MVPNDIVSYKLPERTRIFTVVKRNLNIYALWLIKTFQKVALLLPLWNSKWIIAHVVRNAYYPFFSETIKDKDLKRLLKS